MNSQEIIDLKFAIKDSRRQAMMDEDMRRRSFSHHTSGASGSGMSSRDTGYGPPSRDTGYGPPSRPPRSASLREESRSRRSVEEEIRGMDPYAFRSQAATQKTIKTSFLSDSFKKVGRAIGKYMMFNAIPFNTADSGPYYQVMIDTIAEYGKGVKGPSGKQLAGEFLEWEVEELKKYVMDLKKKCVEYGCTVMCDGWSSRNKHPIVNFMIYCKGDMIFHKSADYIYNLMKDVVEEVGKENVVHVVTDNETTYKAAGKKLMKKYSNLFWSPCAAHCIDLMLEDIGNIPTVASLVRDAKKITSFIYNSNQFVDLMRTYTNGRELLRPGITRFATEFIAIESLIRYKNQLKSMFTSDEWRELSYVRNNKRKDHATEVSQIVLGLQFWKRAEHLVAAMEPLVLVLKLVDQEKKPTMSVIYDAMDRAKLGIKNSNIKEWKKIWDIIDSRWEKQLHCYLHAAGYFLNPMSRYGQNFSYDDEVRLGVKEVIKRLEPDVDRQAMALTEVTFFNDRKGSFGTNLAQTSITRQSPAEWWYHHGEDTPNLRRISIKVLSQTCSSSGCERNWSTFSLIHTKIRNRLAMAKLEKLVFVHYNLRLRVGNLTVKASDNPEYCPIDLNHIFDDQDILDPWIVETEEPLLDGADNEWLQHGLQDFATSEGRRQQEKHLQTSGSGSKQKTPVYVVEESTSAKSSSNDGGDGDENEGGNDDINPGNSAGNTWDHGHDNFYATQDTDHGYRPGIDAHRGHLNRLTDFPSQSPSYEDARRSTGNFPDNMMGRLNLGQYSYPQTQQMPGGDAPSLHRSFSSGLRGRHGRSRPAAPAPTLPILPPASPYVPQPPARWSREREKSTSTSSGGYYDRPNSSGSQSHQHGLGSESSSSFGPTGHEYEHGWISATPSDSYGGDTSFSKQGDTSHSQTQSNDQSQSWDYGSDIANSLFSFPQTGFYGQSSFEEEYERHHRSYGN